MPPTDVTAQVTVLSEGTRGTLTQAYLDWQGIPSENPQIYALGVTELWEVNLTWTVLALFAMAGCHFLLVGEADWESIPAVSFNP